MGGTYAGGTTIDKPYTIEYLGGGEALIVPIRVHDCAGELQLLTVTGEQARELAERILATLGEAERPVRSWLCQRCGHEPSWHRVSSSDMPDPCIKDGCGCGDFVVA